MTPPALTVLVIDSRPADLQWSSAMLEGAASAAWAPRIIATDSVERALAVMMRERPDVVLLGLDTTDARGLDAVQRLRRAAPAVPVVIAAAPASEALAFQAVQDGAQDYVLEGVDDARVLRRAVRHAVERAALARRATRTRDQVLGIVSHDLRNPISAIGLCAAALRADGHTAAERERLLATIRHSVEWTQRLLGDLLDIASIEADRLSVTVQPIDPIVVIGRALELFELTAREHTVRVADDVPDVLPAIAGDQQRILQVLTNLISNALKFTPKGGTITLGALLAGDALRFTVADTGPGIAPEDVTHIFDWFWRASHERAERGTGLGLAIAKGIVEAHGGRIWVSSVPGHGTTISFTIPLAVRASAQHHRPQRHPEPVPA